jgi:NADH dehydrogenase FAD-containing subunit
VWKVVVESLRLPDAAKLRIALLKGVPRILATFFERLSDELHRSLPAVSLVAEH